MRRPRPDARSAQGAGEPRVRATCGASLLGRASSKSPRRAGLMSADLPSRAARGLHVYSDAYGENRRRTLASHFAALARVSPSASSPRSPPRTVGAPIARTRLRRAGSLTWQLPPYASGAEPRWQTWRRSSRRSSRVGCPGRVPRSSGRRRSGRGRSGPAPRFVLGAGCGWCARPRPARVRAPQLRAAPSPTRSLWRRAPCERRAHGALERAGRRAPGSARRGRELRRRMRCIAARRRARRSPRRCSCAPARSAFSRRCSSKSRQVRFAPRRYDQEPCSARARSPSWECSRSRNRVPCAASARRGCPGQPSRHTARRRAPRRVRRARLEHGRSFRDRAAAGCGHRRDGPACVEGRRGVPVPQRVPRQRHELQGRIRETDCSGARALPPARARPRAGSVRSGAALVGRACRHRRRAEGRRLRPSPRSISCAVTTHTTGCTSRSATASTRIGELAATTRASRSRRRRTDRAGRPGSRSSSRRRIRGC